MNVSFSTTDGPTTDSTAAHNESTSAEMQIETKDCVLVEAINLALHYEMARDTSVVVLGEDVATNGGVFRATLDLKQAFGAERVRDTPLAEGLIAGLSVGMATQGLKPVAEIQFMGFMFAALEQLICHAARIRNRTRGRLTCPLVVRMPFGGGIHTPEHHSESTEALLAHIPGLRVVIPSSANRAYGLLLGAIRDPDPVIFLEPKRIYRAKTQSICNDGQALPIDTCFTLREGSLAMSQSHVQVVAVTINDDARLGNWGKKEDATLRLLHALVAACQAEPLLNSWFDAEAMTYRSSVTIDVGMAVDTPGGLFVPVLHDVAKRSDKDLRSGLNRLKKDALKRRIPVNEMQKPTITLSNFGTIAGRYANPVIVLPTMAILAAGVIRDEVCAVKGKAKVLPVMPLSLSFDHHLITGGEAARFMAALKDSLEG